MGVSWSWFCRFVFLSTLPARGATGGGLLGRIAAGNFYPRSPRGERRVPVRPISLARLAFLSTLPARGATRSRLAADHAGVISIHAPREGSDQVPPIYFASFG